MTKTLSVILEELENITATYSAPRLGQTARASRMYERDLKASVDALTKLIKYNVASRTKPLSNQHDINNLVKTSSNLLRLANLPVWKTALEVTTISSDSSALFSFSEEYVCYPFVGQQALLI